MEFLTQLWLPILLSTVVVFVAGSVMNMVMPHHRKDYTRLPDEEVVRQMIKAQNLSRAQYTFPFVQSKEDWNSPETRQKFKEGPVGFLLIGRPSSDMTRQLIQHAVYILCVSVIVAYVAHAALGAGAGYLTVFQVTGVVATLAYSAAMFSLSIWFHFPWANVLRHVFDGLVYGLLTAGFFGWLW